MNLPGNHTYEMALVAGALADRGVLPLLGVSVTKQDFTHPILAEFWHELVRRPDCGALEIAERLKVFTTAGHEDIDHCAEAIAGSRPGTESELVSIAESVADLSVRRRQILAHYDAIGDLSDLRIPPSEAEDRFSATQSRGVVSQDLAAPLEAVTGEFLDEVRKSLESGEVPEIETGLSWLDLNFRFQRGRLLLLGARQKTGKTFLIQQLLLNAAKRGNKCLWLSTEMDHMDLSPRIYTQLGVDWAKDHLPRDFDQLQEMHSHQDRIGQLPVSFKFTTNALQALRTMAHASSRNGVDIVAVDYFQDMYTSPDWGDSYLERQAEFIRRLKTFAKQHRCLMIAVSSTRKSSDGNDDAPLSPSDMFGSASLGFTADYIATMHRPHKKLSNLVCLEVPQSRAVADRFSLYLLRNQRTLMYEKITSHEAKQRMENVDG